MRAIWEGFPCATIRVVVACAAVAATVAGIAVASGQGPSADVPPFERLGQDATFTTVFRSPLGIDGLTANARGDLYSAQRAPAGAACPVQRVSPRTGAATVVGFVAAPCSPSGLTFDRQGTSTSPARAAATRSRA